MSTCNSCGADIIWAVTRNGKGMPLDAKTETRIVLERSEVDRPLVVMRKTYVSHFSTCPNAATHRSKS